MTLLIPVLIISLAQSMQGQWVQYSVAPSSLMPDLAAYEMAPASACTVLVQGALVLHVSGLQ